MGGNAFTQKNLQREAFPRIPPPVYQALKARLTPRLQQLFQHVATPSEAPAKLDHGDLDFSVADLRPGAQLDDRKEDLPVETVRDVIGATLYVAAAGFATSNFAVPIAVGEWSAFGEEYAQLEEAAREACADLYYQVFHTLYFHL
jgi:hypothetical protein